jgi:hypothetical protein
MSSQPSLPGTNTGLHSYYHRSNNEPTLSQTHFFGAIQHIDHLQACSRICSKCSPAYMNHFACAYKCVDLALSHTTHHLEQRVSAPFLSIN